ncbi:hypothetical protein V6Z11_D13G090400 [Gossypium hirsutum]
MSIMATRKAYIRKRFILYPLHPTIHFNSRTNGLFRLTITAKRTNLPSRAFPVLSSDLMTLPTISPIDLIRVFQYINPGTPGNRIQMTTFGGNGWLMEKYSVQGCTVR